MKKILFLSLLFILFTSVMVRNTNKSNQVFQQLYFMEGTWQGNGWIMVNGKKKNFVQNEVIEFRVDSTILVIDGIGYSKEGEEITENVIHNAFGVISFNSSRKKITILSYATTGDQMENNLELLGPKKLEWSFKDERGGTIRFREDFSKDSVWKEQGHYSPDGEKWFPFFEMILQKQMHKIK